MLLGQATMSTSSCSDNSFAPSPIDNSDYDPHMLPPFLSPLKLKNLCDSTDDVTELEILANPHPWLYQQIAHFQSLDWTIQCLERLLQKEQEKLHEVFSVLEREGITELLVPLIVHKRVERYKPYQVYQCWWQSPASIPLPESPPAPIPIPSCLQTPSPKSPKPSQKSKPLSSYHMAPSWQDKVIWYGGCDEEGYMLEKCTHNYQWHPDTETYTLIPYGEKTTVPCYSGWTPVLESRKAGKSST